MAKEVTYTVRGHWPFPIDMLRHDASRAASDADQALIDKLSADHTEDASYWCDVDITLKGFCKPNSDRWESFGWSVPADIEHAFYRQAREQARKRKELVASALAKLTAEERAAVEWEMSAAAPH
jgi:hypothetical protein